VTLSDVTQNKLQHAKIGRQVEQRINSSQVQVQHGAIHDLADRRHSKYRDHRMHRKSDATKKSPVACGVCFARVQTGEDMFCLRTSEDDLLLADIDVPLELNTPRVQGESSSPDQYADWLQSRLPNNKSKRPPRAKAPSRVRVHICNPDLPSKSITVFASIELRADGDRHLILTLGHQALASFYLGALKMSRFWGATSSTDRIVAMTIPDCDPDDEDAIYLRLDSYQSLEGLSRMTGFDLD